MAFKTLDSLRTGLPGLNSTLGLAADTDNSFGTTDQRNAYLQEAFRRLWPRMARLRRETVTTVTNQQDYTLTTLYEIERIEILDKNTPTLISDRVRSWQLFVEEAADPPTIRLLLPNVEGGRTLRCIGYAPYIMPANGAATCDLPPMLEHVVLAGARAEAYRAKLNSFANFERHQNENRANALSVADFVELLARAEREFARLIVDNARNLSGAHRARLQTG